MAYDLSFAMLHWGHDPERMRNAVIAWNSLQRLTRHLSISGHLVEARLYDFSHDHPLSEAIHLPYPDDVYEKSAKINSVLRLHLADPVCDEPKYIAFFDGDIMILQEDWDAFDTALRAITERQLLLFETHYSRSPLPLVPGTFYIDESKLELEWHNGQGPTCGRLFIVPFQALAEIGGFDERFKVWGAEDHDVQHRLIRLGLTPVTAHDMLIVHLHHTPHKLPYTHPEYRKQWAYYKKDQTIVRNGGPL
jgi:hypothetical protein